MFITFKLISQEEHVLKYFDIQHQYDLYYYFRSTKNRLLRRENVETGANARKTSVV